MSHFAIACYRPKPGMESKLHDLVRSHFPVLAAQGLVTDRPPYIMQAGDGTVIEVFEWASLEAKNQAHRNEAVGQVWGKMAECADFPPIGDLAESRQPFSSFGAFPMTDDR